MTTKLDELNARRLTVANEYTAIRKSASGTPEDEARLTNIYDELMKLDGEIATETKMADLDAKLNAKAYDLPASSGATSNNVEELASLRMKAFRLGLANGHQDNDYQRALSEIKNLNATVDDQGAYLVPPPQWINELLKDVDDAVDIRKYAKVIKITRNEGIGIPSLDTDLDDADWTVELATGNIDTAMRIGKREMFPHPFAKRIKLSKTLVRSSVMDVDALIRQRIAYKVGVTEEKAFLTGSGSQQPLGLFTADSRGIGTDRDVTASAATTFNTDDLHNVVGSLKPQHLRNARWIMHRDVITFIRKLKDGNGQYLWQPGIVSGVPDRILNFPYISSEFAPNTFTTGLYMALFGDLSNYWILDNLDMTIQVLYEVYAENNQVAYVIRKELDGAPSWDQGFARLKLA